MMQTFYPLFSSVHHCLSRKTSDNIVKLYFCRNSPVRLLILVHDYYKKYFEKIKV